MGLDRIEDIDVSKTRYSEQYSYNLKDFFLHSFGITNDNEEKPQLIRLQFSHDQAEYIKAYPLHSSQKQIEENKKLLVIELNVFITYDLIKELLSYGADLVVLSPVSLRNEIKKSLSNTLNLYTK